MENEKYDEQFIIADRIKINMFNFFLYKRAATLICFCNSFKIIAINS